ncbi:MAG: response regulator transcription factor [Rhodocyclaceae bacterium]|nr:response regulator transcription factor [Rhodocyclaceae bacterium]MCP5297852.1 response regulator transcription factor [Zoogloeaceae bacterium]MBX3678425.1 response regulator transcription factor [Rhodocyclaceae bacterium]MBZ0133341.1 response regulator transcription factor [Rhodocyclaceae bacterium]MCB1892342.1 response regulator transcription factor [Rhodocyclaceae bacterium]
MPRWREAFPAAIGLRFDNNAKPKSIPTLLWVRLPSNRAVAPLLADLRRRLGNLPCILLSDIPDDNQALAGFSAAARGYCNTHAAPAFLQQVADVVGQGGLWIGETLMNRLVDATALVAIDKPADPAESWASLLTPREQEVARAVAEGASNKEIARGLGITERTVKLHVGAVLEKLAVRDRLQIALIVNNVRQSQSA